MLLSTVLVDCPQAEKTKRLPFSVQKRTAVISVTHEKAKWMAIFALLFVILPTFAAINCIWAAQNQITGMQAGHFTQNRTQKSRRFTQRRPLNFQSIYKQCV
ncbi:hypothetical protein C7N43_00430 [Sphingobacteriales bacterium UPWRP_1]|nr:hypothetical protein BVG80_15360 [Sphingobacteriales bacterium TSM_CSM]PSJ79125.1 hypothetical protein C7N43_00430 [Sphingobacteriales bacterium UPWRP_1]